MRYENIIEARFNQRLNRFVASVTTDEGEELCHVRNTGRCKELFLPGVRVFLEKSDNPSRKYRYSLVTVEKEDRLINIDSSAPNKAVYEWLEKGGYFKNITLIRPECTFGNSRFDFYVEYEGRKAFVEVKGVTLEKYGEVSFPDAPTQRGRKHINELIGCIKEGYEAYILFVVQMRGVSFFTPNESHDPAFAGALKNAQKNGVNILCFDCDVTRDSMEIADRVEVRI